MNKNDEKSVARLVSRRTDGNSKLPRRCNGPLRSATLQLISVIGLVGATLLQPAAIGVAQAQRLVAITGTSQSTLVNVTVGKAEDIRIDSSFTDILVGDPEICDVHPFSDHALSILGKKIGTTRISVYGEGHKLIGVFDVEVSYDVSRLQAEIRRLAGGSITVTSVNGRLMLGGTAPDAVTLDRAVVVARQFAPDVINAVNVLQQQQVLLEVRFVEASRQAGRDLGVQWNIFSSKSVVNIGSRKDAGSLPITAPTSTTNIPVGEVAAGVLSGASPYGFALARMIANGVTIDSLVNALEQKGLARSLAEPNLVALSGDTASFLAGGEYPVPVPGANGTVAIDYKRYGVGLAFTPTVLRDGVINLKINPEVSELDTSHTVQVAGIAVPPLIVRRASTTVELRDGQSFVIGGLLQNKGVSNMQQLPWLGDVPVIGALFRSASYQKNETDLVIIVTPHIVRPTRPGEIVKTPLDNSLPPNDADIFLLGKTEVGRPAARVAAGDLRPYTGHVLDLPKGDVHVVAK